MLHSNSRRATTALLAGVLGLTLLTACSPNGSTATPEPAPTQTKSATASPTRSYISPVDRADFDVSTTRVENSTSISWRDLRNVIERQETPVIVGLVSAPGATLTLTGSSTIELVSVEGTMKHTRNSDGDLVLSPRTSSLDAAVTGSGGEIALDMGDGTVPVLIRVRAIIEGVQP